MMRRLLSLAVVVAALGACGSDDGGDQIAVTGSATYLQRIAMPAGATATVVVQEVSRADAPATNVGESVVELDGVPFEFQVDVSRDEISADGHYALRVTIVDRDDVLLWTTDTVTPVEFGSDGTVDIGELTLAQVSR